MLLTAITSLCLVASPGAVTWTDRAESLGIAGSSTDVGSGIGGGVVTLDADGDGLLDLVVASPIEGVRVLRQTSAGWAIDPAALPALPFAVETAGVTTLDMEADGDDDLIVIRNGTERLLRNDGGVFTDLSDTHLPEDGYWSVSAAVGDVDGDGDDDVYVGNYVSGQLFPAHFGAPNRLLLNDGRGRFQDVAAAVGLNASPFGCTLAVMWLDVDDDGDLDLVDANDFGAFSTPNALWRNEGLAPDGLPRFVDASESSGFRDRLYGMGLAAGDLDGDDRPDLVVTSIGRGVVRQSSPTGFQDVTEAIGASVTWADDGFQVTWTPVLMDLDGDGLLDLFETGGHVHAAPFIANGDVVRNVTFRGRPGGSFRLDPDDLILPSHPENNARGVAVADVDGDGLPELAIAHASGLFSLLHAPNDAPRPLMVVPHPTETGPSATGFSVRATCGEATHRFFLVGGGAFGSASQRALWLTLPGCAPGSAVSLVARWPSGLTTVHSAPMGSRVDLDEPSWIELTATGVRLRPVDAVGVAITDPTRLGLSITSGGVGPVALGADGWFTAGLTTSGAEAWLTLTVDGLPLPVHPHLPNPTQVPVILTQPRHVIEGQPAHVVVVFPGVAPNDAMIEVGGLTFDTEPAADPAVLRTTQSFTPGSSLVEDAVTVTVRVGEDVAASRAVTIEGPFDESVSRIRIGARLWLEGVSPPALGVVVSLRDANGNYPAMDSLSYVLSVDGAPKLPSGLSTNTSQALASFPLDAIPDGASLEVVVAGHPLGAAQPFTRLTTADGLAVHVDAARSTCGASMTTARADGQDRVTMLILLRDAFGNPIPSVGPPPTVAPALGVTIASGANWSADDRHQVVVTAGTTPGELELPVSLGGAPTGLFCRLTLLTPPQAPLALDPATSRLTVLPHRLPVASTAEAEVHLWPRDATGRLLGSGLTPSVTSSIGAVTSLTYAGLGRYDATFTPGETLGFGELTATLGPSSVSVPVEIFDPAAIPLLDVSPTDAGGAEVTEPQSPDTVDSPPDAAPADDTEGAADTPTDSDVSASSDLGTDAPTDAGSLVDATTAPEVPVLDGVSLTDAAAPDTVTAEVPEVQDAPEDTNAPDEVAPDVGPAADDDWGSPPGDTLTPQTDDASHAKTSPQQDGGCAASPSAGPTWSACALTVALALLWARRRRRPVPNRRRGNRVKLPEMRSS